MDDLTRIGIETGTDAAFYHTFTSFYEPYFRQFRYAPITILEIGICEGTSLQMLAKYFPNAQIHGIDANPKSVRNYGERIHTYLCSQIDKNRLAQLFGNMKFDIIIDDGSHVTSHQQTTLGLLFEQLNPKGLYVCEDIHTSLSPNSVDTRLNTIDFLKSATFESECIPPTTQKFISSHVSRVDFYKRTTMPYKCWNCKQPFQMCSCGKDIRPSETDSQTAVLVRV
jgi:cyclopropane fatty-acyl-phospholipid synthase-like methyltransferase